MKLKFLNLIIVTLFSYSELTGQIVQKDLTSQNGKNYLISSENNVPGKRGHGACLFTGYAILSGNVSEYFTNPFYLGLNLDFFRGHYDIQPDGYIGFSHLKSEIEFSPNVEWEKRKAVFPLMGGVNMGYSLFDGRNIKIVPLAGIGFTSVTTDLNPYADNHYTSYEPFIPQYKLGIYIDFKSLRVRPNDDRFNFEDDSYTCLKISFGFISHIGVTKLSDYYKGSSFYITVGIGGFVRKQENENNQKIYKT